MNISQKIPLQLLLLFCCTLSFSCAQDEAYWRPQGQGIKKNFCRNPGPSANAVDIKWMTENVRGGYNIQFGNPTGKKLLAELIGGLGTASRVDYLSGMCARIRFDSITDKLFTGIYSGFGGKVAPFSCIPGASLNCTITSSDRLAVLPSRSYISYVDHVAGKGKGQHNLAGVVKCMPHGEVIWYAMTASKTISPEETFTIIQHFKSLGLNTDIILPMQSAVCQRQGWIGSGWGGNRGGWGQRRQWG